MAVNKTKKTTAKVVAKKASGKTTTKSNQATKAKQVKGDNGKPLTKKEIDAFLLT